MISNEISAELVRGFRGIFGSQLVSVVLYGSAARGDDGPESDVDIALFLRKAAEKAQYDEMIFFLSDMGLKYDRMFSSVNIEQSGFDKWVGVLPYYQNIRREGIVLWNQR